MKGSIEWKYQQIAKSCQIFHKKLKTLSLVVSRVCFGFNYLAFWNLQQSTPNKIQIKNDEYEPQIPSVRNNKMQLSLLHHLIPPFSRYDLQKSSRVNEAVAIRKGAA